MKILLALDTGVDDALALAYALGDSRADLVGVIAHYGNIGAHTAYRNTKAVLDICGCPDVPVYLGAWHPSWSRSFVPDVGCQEFHGYNGLGNLDTADYGAEISSAKAVFSPVEYELWRDADEWERCETSVGGYKAGSEYARAAVMDDSQISVTTSLQSSERLHCAAETLLPSSIQERCDFFSVQEGKRMLNTNRVQEAGCVQGNSAFQGADLSEGARVIIDTVRTYGSGAVIVATGPLTDIATALAAAPEIASSMRLVAMGGAFAEPGNCYDGVSEANIIHDPEAAAAVLASGADVTMVCLDVTHRCLLSLNAADSWRKSRDIQGGLSRETLEGVFPDVLTETLPESQQYVSQSSQPRCARPQAGEFFADLAAFSIKANAEADLIFAQGMPLHDPLAVAVALDSSYVECVEVPLGVQTVTDSAPRADGGGSIRGRLVRVGSYARTSSVDGELCGYVEMEADSDCRDNSRTRAAIRVDSERFLRDFTQTIRAAVR